MDNTNIIRERRFKGYKDADPPEFLTQGYLADIKNGLVDGEVIRKRGGYTAIGTTAGAYPCQGLRGVRFADGTKHVYAVFNGSVYYWSGSGNLTSLGGTLSTTEPVEIVVANNAVYFFDGTNTVVKVNSSNSLSTVAAIPKGKYALWLNNQLHVVGMSATPNTLESSDIGNPENFSSGAYSSLGINPNDGDEITGLSVLNGQLIVTKKNRIWSLINLGTNALTLDDLVETATGTGNMSHRSLVNTGNDLFYVSFMGGKVHIRSLLKTRNATIIDGGIMSGDIETSLEGVNKSRLNQVASVFDGRDIWFSFPAGGGTTNSLVFAYNILTKGWSRHTGIRASCFDIFSIGSEPQVYFGDASSVGFVHRLDGSTSDNGSNIDFQVKSRRYGGTSPESRDKWTHVYVGAKETGNYDLDVDYSVDGFGSMDLGTINLAGTGSIFNNIILGSSRLGTTSVAQHRITIPKTRSRYIDFSFSNSSTASEIEIRNWEVLHQPQNPTEI